MSKLLIAPLLLAAALSAVAQTPCPTCVNGVTLPLTVGYSATTENLNANTDAAATGNGTFTVNLTVAGSFSIGTGTFQAWCGSQPRSSFDSNSATAADFSTYSAAFQGAVPLPTAATWNEVNYILNNKQGTVSDVQDAIWFLITGNSALTPPASAALAMVTGAQANTGYFPPAGGRMAVYLAVGSPTIPDATNAYLYAQNLIVEIPVPAGTSTNPPPPPPPSFTLTKKASTAKCNPYQKVTYTYVLTNTGTTPITNLTIVDDNGTPGDKSDDETVGSLGPNTSIAPGASKTFTRDLYPPVTMSSNYDEGWGIHWGWQGDDGHDLDYNNQLPGGTMICKDKGGNKLEFTYVEDQHLNDNHYGNGASWDWGWFGHAFSQISGNQGTEFAVLDKNGNNVLDFSVDYISQNYQSKSGYSSLGVKGGNGHVYKGDSRKVLDCDTSLSQNLNKSNKYSKNTTHSPTQGTKDWDSSCRYKVTVDTSDCGAAGFGGIKVPTTHDGHSKWWGCDDRVNKPVSSTVTNTAVATVVVGTTSYTASAKATVNIDASPTGWKQCSKY